MKKRCFLTWGVIALLAASGLSACRPAEKVIIITVPAATAAPTPTRTPVPTVTITPSITPAPRLGCQDQEGQLSAFQVEDLHLFSKPMDVNIYLPPCYSNSYPGGYPVLYLLHGQSFSNDQWIRLGVQRQADAYFLSGRLKPFIVVMPREEYDLQNWKESPFDDLLVNAVIPWVDNHYHTCRERHCRAVGGLSRGATWAVVLGLTQWPLFGSIGAHSLPDVPFIEAATRDYFKSMAPQNTPRILIDTGQTDGLYLKASEFEGYLKKYAIPHEWRQYPGGHNEDYWRAHVVDYLLWYGEGW